MSTPFGAPDALISVRENDPATGQLVRVFVPDRHRTSEGRGVEIRPESRLYCVGQDHVVAFDFSTGGFLGPVVQLPRLNGQALVALDQA